MSSSDSAGPSRTVYLPLETLDRCSTCKSAATSTLSLCSACGERIYCSKQCQTKDWPNHKPACGKTDRLDLDAFYPFLAVLTDAAHIYATCFSPHPALTHTITNTPLPNSRDARSPGTIVILGEPTAQSPEFRLPDFDLRRWWPSAASDFVRFQLFRRILYEGNVVPILVALSTAILAEIYTTTAEPAPDGADVKAKHRVRLSYHKSPIADFGIVKGKYLMPVQDRLLYINRNDRKYWKGQDPDDHYWLYFKTIKGEEVTLDLSLFTFGFYMTVDSDAYTLGVFPRKTVPAFFRNRFAKFQHEETEEKRRFSVLRNKHLYADTSTSIGRFMNRVAGRDCTEDEKRLAMTFWTVFQPAFRELLASRAWTEWPADPRWTFERIPLAPTTPIPGELAESFPKLIKKWTEKGQTREALWSGLRKFQRKYEASRG